MKSLAVVLGLSLLACSTDGGEPSSSPTIDVLSYLGTDGKTYVDVSFAQTDESGCDPTDFLLPGQDRIEDDVINYCPTATCVSEVRLLRGAEVLETHTIELPDPRVSFSQADTTGLELELRGCGQPQRLPLWESTLPQGAKASLVPGEPGNAIRIATDMPSANVSLMSGGYGGLGDVREHSEAGAASVRVGMPGYQTFVSVDEIEAHGSVDLAGTRVRRWSGQNLYSATLCLPVASGDRWDVGCASASGTTQVTVSAFGSETVVALTASAASLDEPDASGHLTWTGDAVDTTRSTFTELQLEQGATTDTLGLRPRPPSPLVGPLYQATTAHVEPGAPLGFDITADKTEFSLAYGALHFVNTEDASDSFDIDSLAFRWSVVPIVPRP